MAKKTRVTYTGLNKDISKSKYSDNLYFDANNVKLTPVDGQSFGALSNAFGNELALTLPAPVIDSVTQTITYDDQIINYTNLEINDMPPVSGKQQIIGNANTKNGFVLISTDNKGFDCIWEITDAETQPLPYKLLYCRNLALSTAKPAQVIYNYENPKNQKIYWVDGDNFLRFLNIEEYIYNGYERNLIDLPQESVNSKSTFNVTQPEVIRSGGGGVHTAGMIQYAYTLYNLNGAETSPSPLSNLFPLDKGDNLGGGAVNEVVGAMPIVSIQNIDTRYNFMKLYSIKYTDYNTAPSVSLIYDAGIGDHAAFTFNDTGSTLIAKVSLADFLLTGADAVKPKHIATKDNRLLIANNKVTTYQLDIDTRAYSYNQDGTEAKIYNSVIYTGVGDVPYDGDSLNAKDGYELVPEDFDAVNLDYDTYRYKSDIITPTNEVVVDSAVYVMNTNSGVPLITNDTDLPLTAVNGETTVINGEIALNYTGGVKIDIASVVNVLTSIPTNTEMFSLAVMKNNVKFNTIRLDINGLGVRAQNHTVNMHVESTDIISLALVTEGDLVNLNSNIWNLGVSGSMTVTETVSAGTNNEGGSGKYLQYELTRLSANDVNTKVDRFFKDNDIYRIGILFRNSLGQETEAKWIADFKAPEGNLRKQYNTLKIEFTEEFYNYVDSLDEEDKPVSYSVLRAIRNADDKTIVTQGLITGMMVQQRSKRTEDTDSFEKRAAKNPTLLKVPQLFTRGYGLGGSTTDSYYPVYPSKHNKEMTLDGAQTFDRGYDHPTDPTRYRYFSDRVEIMHSEIHSTKRKFRAQTPWQFNKLMQMHSPDAAFHAPINTTNTDKLVILGYMKRDVFEWKAQQTNQDTLAVEETTDLRFEDGEPGHFYYVNPEHAATGGTGTNGSTTGPPGTFNLVGPSFREWNNSSEDEEYGFVSKRANQLHSHKIFYDVVSSENTYEIYGKPEVTEIGQAPKYYNDDNSLKYANTHKAIITDMQRSTKPGEKSDEPGAVALDTEGTRCITFALGAPETDTEDRLSTEDLFNATNAGGADWDSELFGEIRRSKEYIYSGTLYGGYTYFSRSKSEYANIHTAGIEEDSILIKSPGDTYVQLYKNTRLTRSAGSVYQKTHPIVCETLEYLVESSINLEERDDISIGVWGKVVDPYAEEANKYNRVYSTDVVFKTYFADNLKIKAISELDTQIMASKLKLPGEFIESWVNFLPNEVQNLDGEYGPVNGMIVQNDLLYAFQDFAVASVAINPRVQVQGADGVEIQLGAGRVLHDYAYVTTKAGSVNKWGITAANSGVYFTDSTTKQMLQLTGSKVGGVSEAKGLHSFLYNNLDKSILEEDNPIEGKGVSSGVDIINGDVYTTVQQEKGKSFTVAFNEKLSAFTSFYDFTPSSYIMRGDKMFTVSPDNNQVWLHYNGNYQSYYGTKYPSDITLLINTDDVHAEKIFNNIEFDSEVTLDGVDVAASTITSIEAWNDYQRSGVIPLVVGENIRRRMRTWRATIPRMEASRMRLRDKWLFLKLGFNPENNEKLVLHDMIVGYNEK